MDPSSTFLLFVALFGFIIIALLWSAKGAQLTPTRYFRGVRGEYGEQWEFDLRLTYKRFREIYPFSELTYDEFKKLQAQRAFRRAISSTKNKRMVR